MCCVYLRNNIGGGWFAEGGNRRQSVGNRRHFRKTANLFLNDRRYDCSSGQSNGRSSTPKDVLKVILMAERSCGHKYESKDEQTSGCTSIRSL